MTDLLLKYVKKVNEKDVFHSSAYAKAQNGAAMGAASSQSFADRRRMEQNRRMVQGYGGSKVVSSTFSNGPKAKTFSQEDKQLNHDFGGTKAKLENPKPGTPAPKPVSMPRSIGLFGKK